MEYEPPDSYNDSTTQNNGPRVNNFQKLEGDCSPLLRPFPGKNFNSVHQNRNNANGNQYFKPPIRNRLGNRNYYKNNNNGDTNSQGYRMYNKRRNDISDLGVGGPTQPKRKWIKKQYYPNKTLQANQNHVSVQGRLDKIKHANESTENVEVVENSEKTDNETLNEIDATDITVEVVNPAAIQAPDENCITRFKMILNPKTQAAIKMIQSKRKEKQIIFPFPVTPNCTEISINERFSLL